MHLFRDSRTGYASSLQLFVQRAVFAALFVLLLTSVASAQTDYTIPTVDEFQPISVEGGLDLLAFPGLSQSFGYGLWWSQDGSRFAVGTEFGAVMLYDVSDFSALPQRISAMYAETGRFAFNPIDPDRAYLANKNSNGDAYVAVIDLPTGATVDHFDCVGEYALVAPNGRRLLSMGQGQYVIFDLDRGSRQLAFESFDPALELGERGVYLLDTGSYELSYRDIVSGAEHRVVALPDADNLFPAISTDLSRSAHASDDGTVYVFDLSRVEDIRAPLTDEAADRLLTTITPPSGAPPDGGEVTALDVSINVTAVAYAGGIVTINSGEYGDFQLGDALFEEDVSVLSLQPGGSLLALRLNNGQVQIWDLATRHMVSKLGSEYSIVGFWFDADNQPVAYITYQGADWGWNLLTNEVAQLDAVPMLALNTSATSPDGSVTASITGTETFEVSGFGETRTVYIDDPLSVTFSPDGRFLAAWGSTDIFLMRELTAAEEANPSCIAAG